MMIIVDYANVIKYVRVVRMDNKKITMDTTAKTTEKTILLNLADKLGEAQAELDEFALQLALGKAEAREKYEELKKDFRYRLANFKNSITNEHSDHLIKEIVARIDQLEGKLSAGKTDSKEMFVAQRKLIVKALRAFENEVRKRLSNTLDAQHIMKEIEHFKLKMEILRLRFVLKRFTINDDLKSNVEEVRRRVSILIEKARKKVLSSQSKIIQINRDILGKAFS